MLSLLLACRNPSPTGDSADTAPVDTALIDTALIDTADSDSGTEPEPLNLMVVLDISTSWSQPYFGGVRDGMTELLDAMIARGVPGDRVALVVFSGRYADAMTTWTDTPDAEATVAPVWSTLNVASRSGEGQPFPEECLQNTTDEFGNGGCYPQMPRSYSDEAGTDHSVGLTFASQWIADSPGEGEGAVVMVTDGIANGLLETNGETRGAEGYVETRWPEFMGPVPHTWFEIEDESVALTAEIQATSGYSTFVVSIGESAAFLDDLATGVGTHVAVADASGFGAALADVVGGY